MEKLLHENFEQRFEQLKQVAKELLVCVRKCNPNLALVYEGNLEALGVNVDD